MSLPQAAAGRRVSSEGTLLGSGSWAAARSAQPSPRQLIHVFLLSVYPRKIKTSTSTHPHTALFVHDSIDFVYCSDYFTLFFLSKIWAIYLK